MNIEQITSHELASYLNDNEDRVQELLSAFSTDDIFASLVARKEIPEFNVDNLYSGETKINFSHALIALKSGYKVARTGWNGKGMFIYLVKGSEYLSTEMRAEAKEHVIGGSSEVRPVKVNGHIDMKAADGSIVVGWLASQADLLAEDWVLVE